MQLKGCLFSRLLVQFSQCHRKSWPLTWRSNVKDVITREIVVRATQERVYRAITEPAQIVTWFPDAIEGGTLEVGERPIFIFGSENHRSQIYVEASTPYSYFAYLCIFRNSSLFSLANSPISCSFFIYCVKYSPLKSYRLF